jgi:asparagine synthase (glutamine-hydrolysing)
VILFTAGWNADVAARAAARRALVDTATLFPRLDPSRLVEHAAGRAFVMSMTDARPPADARPVARDVGAVAIHTGWPISRSGAYPATDDAELASRWPSLIEDLEGVYAAVRLTFDPPTLELLTDPLGVGQVYITQQGRAWFLGNSVRALVGVTGPGGPDLESAAMFLSAGWAGGAHTLDRSVSVVPRAQSWVWTGAAAEPTRRTYWSPPTGAGTSRARVPRGEVTRLATFLSALSGHAVGPGGEGRLLLTGGRDSRIVLALMLAGGVRPRCFTSGPPSSPDVMLARRLASHVGSTHATREIAAADIVRAWDGAAPRMVARFDGLVSLWSIAGDLVDASEEEPVSFMGLGGEVAKEFYGDSRFVLTRPDADRVYAQMAPILARTHGGLLRREVPGIVERHARAVIARSIEQGTPPENLATAFYTEERLRRWSGSNLRMGAGEVVVPMFARPFVEAAWSLAPASRLLEVLHRDLLQVLRPDLLEIPFDRGPLSRFPRARIVRWRLEAMAGRVLPWRVVSRLVRRRRVPDVMRVERTEWLGRVLPRIRERCLDHGDHFLWDLVDRATFERITAPRADRTRVLSQAQGLFDTATMFYHFTGASGTGVAAAETGPAA